MKAVHQSGPPSIEALTVADRGSLSERGKISDPAVWTTDGKRTVLAACMLLLVLSTAIFHRALDFRPADEVDLRLFSVAIHTHNPLKYLVGDWGEAPYETGQYGMYRPLHPISLWVVYKLFGFRWFPNQFINFALHSLNTGLLFTLVWRVQKDATLGLMGASMFLISVHTMSPAIWVTDRASLQVGLALLLLMHHLVSARQHGNKPRTWYVFLLCILALLSKESGLIVPLIAIVDAMISSAPVKERIWSATIWASVIGAYILGRFLMFGANAAAYSKGGYLFGFWHYDRVVDLPGYLQKVCLVDNTVKNFLESFLPALNDEGGFHVLSKSEGLCVALGVLAMGCLVALTMKGKLRTIQVECLWIILFNACLHNEVFRYRVLYTAQIAICVFIACSPRLNDSRTKALAVGAASVLLLASTVRVDNYVQNEYMIRYKEMQLYHLEHVMKSFPGKRIDPQLARQLVWSYQDRN
jgi:hypothetical protein